MLDLNVLSKVVTEDSSLNIILKKNAGKLTITVIPVLKPLQDEDDEAAAALYAVLAQPICITAEAEGDVNAFVNGQLQAVLEARNPAQDQLSQYQAQVAEAMNQSRLAEQVAKEKKAKQDAEKAAKKSQKTAAAKTPAINASESEDESDSDNDLENADNGDEAKPEVPVTAAKADTPLNDLFADLGVSA